ncbi:MAG: peptidoglycan D,D-transpeptidase FtsI family protein [Planctomycetota bacterium]
MTATRWTGHGSSGTLLQRGRKLVWLLQAGVVFLAFWTAWLQFGCTQAERIRHETNTVRTSTDLARRGTLTTRDGFVLAQDLLAWRVGIDPASVFAAVERDARVAPTDRVREAARRVREVLATFPFGTLASGRPRAEVEALAVAALEPSQGDDRPRTRYVAIGEFHREPEYRGYQRWEREQRGVLRTTAFTIEPFHRRDYPHPVLASQVVGEVGRDGFGLWGLEAVWDRWLAGRNGRERSERVGGGRMAGLDDGGVATLDGRDLVLTLDSRAQQLLEAELTRTHREWQAERVLGILVEPATGAVRALASTPFLDRGELAQLQGQERMTELARCMQCLASYQFEPGSVMKSFILSEVYRTGVDPTQLVTDGHKTWRYRGRVVTDSSTHGQLDIDGSVVHSSNIGLARVGLLLGGDKVRECVSRFGFGKSTGIGLDVHEWPGSVTPAQQWSYYATTGVPFGYEIGVTTLQLARGYCALVNGGDLVQLHLVERAREPGVGSPPAPIGPAARNPILGDDSAGRRVSERVRATLREVVISGTGQALEKPLFGNPIGLAGKTGTARVSAGKSGYIEGCYRSSFVGFAPFEDPQYLAVVVVVKPQGAHYGGVVAGPAVRRLLGALMSAPSPELEARLDEVVCPPNAQALYHAANER